MNKRLWNVWVVAAIAIVAAGSYLIGHRDGHDGESNSWLTPEAAAQTGASWSPTEPYPTREVYFPGTEALGPDEIRVIALSSHPTLWNTDLAVDNVVSNFEQRRDEGLVASDAVGKDLVAAASGDALGKKTAVGAGRHNNGVLHDLSFHQAKHCGAEIFTSIRPAQTTASDIATAQMDTFDVRRIDKNFILGAR